eukprot:Rhum_TRINITY_DN16709_c0_g1::Rhum_TRINITY_DN16709_c0_g1_i1::g.164143::m.164143
MLKRVAVTLYPGRLSKTHAYGSLEKRLHAEVRSLNTRIENQTTLDNRKEGKGKGKKRADVSVALREDVRAGLEHFSGTPLRELVDLMNNPRLPEDDQIPGNIMRLWIKLERKRHIDNYVKGYGKGTSFAKQCVGIRISSEARVVVDTEHHADEQADDAMYKHVNLTARVPWAVAPVNKGSAKAMHLFGAGASRDVAHIAATEQDFPPQDRNVPEVAFIGVTNRGQSTLINSVCNQIVSPSEAQAHVTKAAIYVECGAKRRSPNIRLIDFPGLSESNESGNAGHKAQQLFRDYLASRSEGVLKAVILTVDGHTGRSYHVKLLVRLLEEHEIPYYYCITRTDQCVRRFLLRTVTLLLQEKSQYPQMRGVLCTSSVRSAGITKLQNVLAEYARIPELGHVMHTDFKVSDILPPLPHTAAAQASHKVKVASRTSRKFLQLYQGGITAPGAVAKATNLVPR